MGFKDNLKEKLKLVLTEQELSFLPSGFQNLGKIMILRLDSRLLGSRFLIGAKCLELYPNFRSIYLNSGKIVGKFRIPEKMELIGGEDNPIVEHKENNVIYRFDITKLMFSKGNVNERKYLTTLVQENEIIVDMFAGIGYFSLPIAKNAKPRKIYSIELNPDAYRYLVDNIKLNHLEDIIIPIQGDCKQEVIKLSKSGKLADRVIMGVLPAPKDYIKEALALVNEKGTIYHYEGVTKKEEYQLLFEEFKAVAKAENVKCELLGERFVKSYGPNLYHVVFDIFTFKA